MRIFDNVEAGREYSAAEQDAEADVRAAVFASSRTATEDERDCQAGLNTATVQRLYVGRARDLRRQIEASEPTVAARLAAITAPLDRRYRTHIAWPNPAPCATRSGHGETPAAEFVEALRVRVPPVGAEPAHMPATAGSSCARSRRGTGSPRSRRKKVARRIRPFPAVGPCWTPSGLVR